MEITNKFNKYFANVIKKLNMEEDTGISFESQESCRIIKTKFWKENFSFEVFIENAIANAIKNLPTGKASVSNDITVSILKKIIDVYCPKLTQIMNDCLQNDFFYLIYFKMLKQLLVLKKEIKVKIENYRPNSILLNFSKVFEGLI